MAGGARTHGFWRGILVGLLLAAVAAVALAVAYPPVVYTPPRIAPEASVPPAAPGLGGRSDAAEPAAPKPGGVIGNQPSAPLVVERPAADLPPNAPGLAPPRAPNAFENSPAGNPSLVPSQ